mmetsp:Transcript_54757/g.102567  ORF Transcript_54757/g.102567 Transcript_54757/m.102567 type:complete len:208 (-) Transcript_54757:1649-2272(-)
MLAQRSALPDLVSGPRLGGQARQRFWSHGVHGRERVVGEPVPSGGVPRAASARGAASAAHGVGQNAAFVPALGPRGGRAGWGVCDGPVLNRAEAAGVLLSLHGGARGFSGHGRQDEPFGVPAALLGERFGGVDGRLRPHGSRRRRQRVPVQVRRRRAGRDESLPPRHRDQEPSVLERQRCVLPRPDRKRRGGNCRGCFSFRRGGGRC